MARARAILHDACLATDSARAARLGLARRKALDASAAHSTTRVWAPLAGGVAACCALAIGLVWMHPFAQSNTAHPVANTVPIAANDTGIATLDLGSGEVEVVQNLDFYSWLAAQQGAPRPSARSER
ncbi:MAG: hypothetical protein ACREP0_06020 [Rhodanobacteraceae bacterium]